MRLRVWYRSNRRQLVARFVCAYLMIFQPLPNVDVLPVLWLVFWSSVLIGLWGKQGNESWLAVAIFGVFRFIPEMHSPLPAMGDTGRVIAALMAVHGPPVRDADGCVSQCLPTVFWWSGVALLALLVGSMMWWHIGHRLS